MLERPKFLKEGCPLCYPKEERVLKSNDLFRVVLVEDSEIPAYIRIILNEHYKEITDIYFNDFQKLYSEIYKIEKIMRDIIKPDKVNIVSFGNYVPHLHFHIIPRFKEDAWFPDSIWSEKKREYQYQIEDKKLEKFIKKISKLK